MFTANLVIAMFVDISKDIARSCVSGLIYKVDIDWPSLRKKWFQFIIYCSESAAYQLIYGTQKIQKLMDFNDGETREKK